MMSDQQQTLRELAAQLRALATAGEVDALFELNALIHDLLPPPAPLAQTRPLLHTLFERAEVCVVVSDLSGALRYTNPAFLNMLGHTQEELTTQQLKTQTHPDDLAHNAALFKQLVSGERAHITYEKRYINKAGELIWAQLNVTTIHLPDEPQAPLLLAFIQDITDIKDELSAKDQVLYSFMESLPYKVWSATPAGEVDYVTDVLATYCGKPKEDFIGASWSDIIHPDDLATTNERWARSFQDKVPYQVELRLRRHDGVYRLHLLQSVPLYDDKGVLNRWYGTANDIHDLRTLEYEAQRMSARHAHTFENMNEAVFIIDHQQRYTFVNSMVLRHVNKSREELIGRALYEVFPEFERSNFAGPIQEAIEQRRPMHIEDYLEPLGRWLSIHAYPCEEGMIFFSLDVTDKRTAQAQLATIESRSRLAAHATSDAIWDWNVQDSTIWWSEGVEELFGIPRDELMDSFSQWLDRIHPQDRQRVKEHMIEVFKSDQDSWSDEYRLLKKDQTYAWVAAGGSIVRDEQGRVTRIVGGLSDDTKRVEATERLREQAQLLDRAQDAILVRSLDHQIIYANKSAARIYGWSTDELIGQSIREIFYQDPSIFDEATAQVLERGEWHGELEHRRKDGAIITVEGRWSLIKGTRADQPSRILAINTDITERKKLSAQFLRAQRLESVGNLAGGIAHDLNNVLTPILLSIELLRSQIQSPRHLDALETITQSAQRGADLVRQVLTFARGVEGQKFAVSLTQLIEDLRLVIRDTFPKTIDFHTKLPDDLWPLLGDYTQIHQVLINLCLNARDAMHSGGTLRINAENITFDAQYAAQHHTIIAGPYVKVSISDDGDGIDADLLDQIFDPFFTTKPVGKGTGLGLSTVAAIMRSHKGIINVYSEPRRGTVFTLYFCAADKQNLIKRTPQQIEQHLYGDQELILIVDDDEPVRKITQQTLESFGYRVLSASDGADAIDLYSQYGPQIDLVITDITMPIMGGPATIRALMHMNPKAKIISTSGLGDSAAIAQTTIAGGRAFLQKPYTSATLLNAIRKVLEED